MLVADETVFHKVPDCRAAIDLALDFENSATFVRKNRLLEQIVDEFFVKRFIQSKSAFSRYPRTSK